MMGWTRKIAISATDIRLDRNYVKHLLFIDFIVVINQIQCQSNLRRREEKTISQSKVIFLEWIILAWPLCNHLVVVVIF